MPTTIDKDLLYRVKDLNDALHEAVKAGTLPRERFDAVIDRLLAAADQLGAAKVGATMAGQLATADGLQHLLALFGQGESALDTAALNLGTIAVHTALDLCAGALLAAVDGRIAAPGHREPGMPQLLKRAKNKPLPELFADWLSRTVGPRYDELDGLWRDPQTHRPVPKAVFAGPPTDDGQLTRASVRIYAPKESNGRHFQEYLGTAAEKLPIFVDFGEERFLALCMLLRLTFAPDWKR